MAVAMNRRRTFHLFVFIVLLCVFTVIYLNPGTASSIASYALIRARGTKTILYWNALFDEETFGLGEGYIARNCSRFRNCWASQNRLFQSIDRFDAIIFHGINKELNFNDLPDSRRPEQKYVFVALESPANRYVNSYYESFFNVTMTYHFDSDVIWTYADVVDLTEKQVFAVPSRTEFKWKPIYDNFEELDFVKQVEEMQQIRNIVAKRKLAIWYRSNCKTKSYRENYVNELEVYVPIDKYGKCSHKIGCPKNADCFKTEVEPNYFFYLSFENSLCDDYVTEKFYNALKYYVVPVVYGGANYSRFAPPKSYINALDFDTPKDLAKYLIYLTQNMTAYLQYFDWKKQYRVVSPHERIICDLCEILNSDNKQKSYEISKWYGMKKCPMQEKLRKQKLSGGPYYATRKTLNIH